jgi:hypothetical protein
LASKFHRKISAGSTLSQLRQKALPTIQDDSVTKNWKFIELLTTALF